MSSKPEPMIWSANTICFSCVSIDHNMNTCPISKVYIIKQGCMSRSTYYLGNGLHVVQCHCHHYNVHVPTIHAATSVEHEHRVAQFSISMHACGSGPIKVMVFCLNAMIISCKPCSQSDNNYCKFTKLARYFQTFNTQEFWNKLTCILLNLTAGLQGDQAVLLGSASTFESHFALLMSYS